MHIRVYHELPKEAKEIREAVFMKEQGFHKEFDETDDLSTHVVLYDKKTPIATCRFYVDSTDGDYYIGRIAVARQYRGQNIGSSLLAMTESEIKKLGGKRIFLHAQDSVKMFYEKQGYCCHGEIDFDENCPHI